MNYQLVFLLFVLFLFLVDHRVLLLQVFLLCLLDLDVHPHEGGNVFVGGPFETAFGLERSEGEVHFWFLRDFPHFREARGFFIFYVGSVFLETSIDPWMR